MMRTILHVDMDAFFASVEVHVHPEWRGKPVVVGAGSHERGVVSTCSYEARRFGIHSAMPSRTAYQLCPCAIFVRPHMDMYKEVSDRAFEVFGHYSPYVEAVSIDEAFLDITGTIHLYGSAARLGNALREEIRRTCHVTCSVGIAPNRLLAKIGSEQNKPDGLTIMPFEPDAIASFLAPKPISILWGVGAKTVSMLKPYGITACGHLQRIDIHDLARILGSPAAASSLKDYAMGISDDHVYWEPREEKSVSREHTFDQDEPRRSTVRKKLLELVEEVGRRFRQEERWAKLARLKMRDATFRSITRQLQLDCPSRDDLAFREAAIRLFEEAWPEKEDSRIGANALRLVGFGVANIQATACDGGPCLFADEADERRKKNERLSEVIDALRERGIMK